MSETILFYDPKAAHGIFSNLYIRDISIGGLVYHSVEHYFQSQKFVGTPDGDWYASQIRQQNTGGKVFFLAQQKKGSRWPWQRQLSIIIEESLVKGVAPSDDWDERRVSVMIRGLCAKFMQHKDLRQKLLDTGDAVLVENSPRDWYWGIGKDGKGKNKLGKFLMILRDQIRNSPKAGLE
jgi:N-glycosidase YbiA